MREVRQQANKHKITCSCSRSVPVIKQAEGLGSRVTTPYSGRLVGGGLSQKATFEQSSGGGEGMNHVDMWGR